MKETNANQLQFTTVLVLLWFTWLNTINAFGPPSSTKITTKNNLFPTSLSPSFIKETSNPHPITAYFSKVKNHSDQDEDEDFQKLYQETTFEGLGLAQEFNNQQQQRRRLEDQQFNTNNSPQSKDEIPSAGFFTRGNTVVESVPSSKSNKINVQEIQYKTTSSSNVNSTNDNLFVILATSLVAQSSQQLLIVEQQQQNLLISLTTLLFIAALYFSLLGDNALTTPNVNGLDTTSTATTSTTTTILSSVNKSIR